MPTTRSDVLVLGSGIAGLATALKAAEHGLSVTVLAKRRAEDVADGVTGVGHVQNNLRVSHAAQPGTLATQTDPRIAAVSEGRSADDAARDLRDDRGRLGALRPNA